MKKTVLSLFLISVTSFLSAQSFSALYDFALVTNTTGLIDPTPVPAVSNANMGSFSAVGTSTNPNANGIFYFSGFPIGATNSVTAYSSMTGSINLGKYYEVTVAPQSGFQINLNTVSFSIRRTSTGFRSYAVRSSVNSYATNLPASITNTILSIEGSNEFFINQDATSTTNYSTSIVNLSGTNITSPLTLRFYAWNSESTSGFFGIDNVLITGTVVSTSTCVVTTTSFQSVMPVTCNGLANGSATISATGDGPLTYTWLPTGGNTSMASGLAAGIYSCIVTNTCGIATKQIVQITQPTILVLSVANSSIFCNGGVSSLTFTATGGNPPYVSPSTQTVTAGTYNYTVSDANNCVATKTLIVSEPNVIMVSKNYTLCAGQTVTVGANTYSAAGTYTDVLTSINGCDSTVNSNVSVINALNNSVTINGLTLSANQTGATYQWVDCNNNNALIANATSQTYTATSNGSYAVVVKIGNCSVTSPCNIVTTVGIKSYNANNSISIYPNPTSGLLTIDLSTVSTETIKVEIRNAIGQAVYSTSLANEYQAINIQHLSAGIYYVLIDNQRPVKLIKK